MFDSYTFHWSLRLNIMLVKHKFFEQRVHIVLKVREHIIGFGKNTLLLPEVQSCH